MRILSTIYEFPPLGGGAGKMAFGLATRLVHIGEEVDILTMGSPGLTARDNVAGVSVFRVPTTRQNPSACTLAEAGKYLALAVRSARVLADERRYELVHSHFIFPDGILAMYVANRIGIPYIVTAHGTDVPGHNPHRMRTLHALLKPMWRRITNRAATIICPSDALADKVKRANPTAKIEVIPNAYDAARFNPYRRRKLRLLSVSRMVSTKGLQYLLHALSELEQPLEVVLVGDGPYAPDLRQLADRLRLKVTFTGWIDNDSERLGNLYETSGLFVFPSEAENCPLALLEAMSAALPIVTTHDPGCQGVVGDSAILVPPRDAKALARAIDRLIRDEKLRDKLGSAARQRALGHFSWEALIKRHRDLYRRVVTNRLPG